MSSNENVKLRTVCEAIVADAAHIQITEPIRHQFDHVILTAATPPPLDTT